MFFGIEFKDGRWTETLCDKSGYNDFERGDNDTYRLSVQGEGGNDVRKIWIRKQRGWGAGTPEDNWMPQEFQLTSSDYGINYSKTVNEWISGNYGFYYDVINNTKESYPKK